MAEDETGELLFSEWSGKVMEVVQPSYKPAPEPVLRIYTDHLDVVEGTSCLDEAVAPPKEGKACHVNKSDIGTRNPTAFWSLADGVERVKGLLIARDPTPLSSQRRFDDLAAGLCATNNQDIRSVVR